MFNEQEKNVAFSKVASSVQEERGVLQDLGGRAWNLKEGNFRGYLADSKMASVTLDRGLFPPTGTGILLPFPTVAAFCLNTHTQK